MSTPALLQHHHVLNEPNDGEGQDKGNDPLKLQLLVWVHVIVKDKEQIPTEAQLVYEQDQRRATAQRGSGQVGMDPGGRDPLGRNMGDGGMEALEGVEIPDQMELRRARRILDELRRRRGERSRPPVELDYIDRLLQQF